MAEATAIQASEEHAALLTNPYRRKEIEIGELAAIVADALAFSPPLFPNSILGHPWTWIPPHPRWSEFNIVSIQQILRSVQYLLDVTVPALPFALPKGIPLVGESVFWRPTTILYEPGIDYNPYAFPEEAWIFINGIATNQPLSRMNAKFLVHLFHRPLTIVQNATDSVGIDLVEASLGKAWDVHTEPAAKAYPFIHRALHNPEKQRVVVICHSQGTIIMSNVLRALLTEEYRAVLDEAGKRGGFIADNEGCDPLEDLEVLKKLEIYNFANAASLMSHMPEVTTDQGNPVPWIENFGNQYDLVARTGMLAPNKEKHGIRIDGGHYVKKGMWGHILNVHYLYGINDHLKAPNKRRNDYILTNGATSGAPERPRLYEYFQGATPEPY
ncbi:MAG: hypothetical protein AAF560_26300 [Acidobacteriota bacterium]